MAYVDSFLGLIHQSLVTTIISYQAKQKRALSGSPNSCGADEGSRTLLSSLGSWRSTDELHLPKCGDRNQNFCRLFYFNLKYLICQFFFMTEGYKLGYDTITITGNGNRFRKIFWGIVS